MIRLHNFLMLGKTVPEPSKTDERIYVCSAGYHPDLGLTRVYPLGQARAPRRWSLNDVTVERNPRDHRAESWRIAGDRHDRWINDRFTTTGRLDSDQARDMLLDDRRIPRSIQQANEARRSLALLTPDHIGFSLKHVPDHPDSPQQGLFDADLAPDEAQRRFPAIPYLHIDGEAQRNFQLRDWGAYEWMRKHPDDLDAIPDALHLGPKSALLVGNINGRFSTWLVISVLNIRTGQLTLEAAS